MCMQAIIDRLDRWFKHQPSGGIIRRTEFPELIEVAPVCGETYQLGRYKITRRRVDELDQFTISYPRPERPRCLICGMPTEPDGSCWWCTHPE